MSRPRGLWTLFKKALRTDRALQQFLQVYRITPNANLRTQGAKVLINGRFADLAFIYQGEKICIFDNTRSMESYVNYGILEGIKNGYLVSTKYAGCTKSFAKPHVVVMANFKPDYNKLSLDRWGVRVLNNCTDLQPIHGTIDEYSIFGLEETNSNPNPNQEKKTLGRGCCETETYLHHGLFQYYITSVVIS